LADEYRSKVADVYLFDPLVDDSRTLADLPKCDVLVLAVPHQILLEMDVKSFIEKLNDGGVMVDIKGKLDRNAFVDSGKKLWRM
jgi:hypothetical protein